MLQLCMKQVIGTVRQFVEYYVVKKIVSRESRERARGLEVTLTWKSTGLCIVSGLEVTYLSRLKWCTAGTFAKVYKNLPSSLICTPMNVLSPK